MLASGSLDRTIKLWNVDASSLAFGECLQTLDGHSNYVSSVVFGAEDSKVASGSADNTVKLWDVTSGQCLQTLSILEV